MMLLVQHCLKLNKVLVWTSIVIFSTFSEHLAMALWSREELLSCLAGEKERYNDSARPWPQKLPMANCSSGFAGSVSFSSGCASIGDKAILRGPVGKSVLIKMLSQCYSVHTYISSGRTIHSLSNVPWGPPALKGDSHSPIHLEMDLWLLSFDHWPCQGVQWTPTSLSVPS